MAGTRRVPIIFWAVLLILFGGIFWKIGKTLSFAAPFLSGLRVGNLKFWLFSPIFFLPIILLTPRKMAWLLVPTLASAGFLLGRQAFFLSLPDWAKTLFLMTGMMLVFAGSAWRKFMWVFYAAPLAFFSGLLFLTPIAWKGLFSLLLLLAICAGLGGVIDRNFGNPPLGSVSWSVHDVLVNVALGSGFLSLLAFALSSVGIAKGNVLVGLLFFLGPILAPFWWPQAKVLALSLRNKTLDLPSFFALGLACTILGLFFLATLAPEMGSDALGGRVALPQKILQSGRLVPTETLINFTMGWSGGELFYVWLYSLVGTTVARLWAWGVLTLLLLWTLAAEKTTGPLVAWLAVAASTHVWWQMFAGFVDLHQAFLTLAAVLAWQNFFQRRLPVHLGVAFFLAGCAAAVKMNGLAVVLALGLATLLVAFGEKKTRFGFSARTVGMASFGFCLATGPWALRSFLLTGNATFPFFNKLWQSPLAPPYPLAPSFNSDHGVLPLILLPWRLFFSPEKYAELGAFNPAIFLVAVVASWLFLKEKGSRIFLFASGWWFVLWLATYPNSRYLLPAMFLLLACWWLGQKELVKLSPGSYLAAVLLIILGFLEQSLSQPFWPSRATNGRTWPLTYIVGRTNEGAYLSSLPTFLPCHFLNSRYGTHYAVWQINVRDFLYCAGTAYDSWHALHTTTSFLRSLLFGEKMPPGKATHLLQQRGVTHIMLRSSNEELRNALMKTGEDFVANEEDCCLIPEFAHGGVRVFRLAEKGTKTGRWSPCQESTLPFLGPVVPTGKTLIYKKLPPGALVRWQVGGEGLAAGNLQATVAGWNKEGDLSFFQKVPWGLKPPNSNLEIWQTLPSEMTRVHLSLAGQSGKVSFVRCEMWQDQAELLRGVGEKQGP